MIFKEPTLLIYIHKSLNPTRLPRKSPTLNINARITSAAHTSVFELLKHGNRSRRNRLAPNTDVCIQPESQYELTLSRDREYVATSRSHSSYYPLQTFELEKEKHYQQQYADIYFLRLAVLKPVVEAVAAEAWADFEVQKNSV